MVEMELVEMVETYLIFVTDTRTVSVEKQICHLEKFQISVHDR